MLCCCNQNRLKCLFIFLFNIQIIVYSLTYSFSYFIITLHRIPPAVNLWTTVSSSCDSAWLWNFSFKTSINCLQRPQVYFSIPDWLMKDPNSAYWPWMRSLYHTGCTEAYIWLNNILSPTYNLFTHTLASLSHSFH